MSENEDQIAVLENTGLKTQERKLQEQNFVIKMQERKTRNRKNAGLKNAGPVIHVTCKRFVTPVKKVLPISVCALLTSL